MLNSIAETVYFDSSLNDDAKPCLTHKIFVKKIETFVTTETTIFRLIVGSVSLEKKLSKLRFCEDPQYKKLKNNTNIVKICFLPLLKRCQF